MTSREDLIESMTPKPVSPELRHAMESIAALASVDVPRLPEILFRTHLLPLLQDTSGEADLRIWQDIAGTVNRPIDVTDTQGNILFRVPALLGTVPTPTTNRERDPRSTYAEIVQMSHLKNEQHPAVGKSYLENALARKHSALPVDMDNLKQWNVVLAYYDLPLMNLGDTPQEAAVAAKGAPITLATLFSGEDNEI